VTVSVSVNAGIVSVSSFGCLKIGILPDLLWKKQPIYNERTERSFWLLLISVLCKKGVY